MRLEQQYDNAIASASIDNDPNQRQVIAALQTISDQLSKSGTWFKRLLTSKSIRGVYIYGDVGVGKTYVMDLFFNYVTESRKKRIHLHQFMQEIDAQLREYQGKVNPLRAIAKRLSTSIRLLCLDEFFILDIADAMILAELIAILLDNGVVLVITSNTPPDDLYRDGVHREYFLPIIAMIKEHCAIFPFVTHQDYRLGRAPHVESYITPCNEHTKNILLKQFDTSFNDGSKNAGMLTVQQRDIPYLRRAKNAIWFSFSTLCAIPRSQLDYLEISERFSTIFLSDVPRLGEDDTTSVVLFMRLIDVIYDRHIRLIVSAEVSPETLYTKGCMLEPFQRTVSRLKEMQSEDWWIRSKNSVTR